MLTTQLTVELCSKEKHLQGAWPRCGELCLYGGDSVLTLGGVGKARQGHPSAHMVCIHTHNVFWELSHSQLLSMSTRCSFAPGTPVQVPPSQALVAAHAQTAAQTMTYTFNFPKDYVFIFKDVASCFF